MEILLGGKNLGRPRPLTSNVHWGMRLTPCAHGRQYDIVSIFQRYPLQ